VITGLLVSAALADDGAALRDRVKLNGDIKSFFTATVPYESPLFPDDPTGQGVADLRLKLRVDATDDLRFEVHHAATALTATSAGALGGTSTGVGLQAPELVDLSWVATDADLTLRGRVDRLSARYTVGPATLTAGRQPVSFGAGLAFTPLDLVNPFTPAVIDQEYKPGVDALRADLYQGMSSLTVVGAWAGDLSLRGTVLAAYGQTTVGVTDLGLFVGSVRGDAVVGTSVVSSVGAVGVHSDVALTLPEEGGDPFVRGVAGSVWRPAADTTLTGELYLQTLGAADPADYLSVATDPRFGRGELWLFGRAYGALSVAQQLTPLISGSAALIANIEDGSAFVAPSLSWNASDNTVVAAGGFVGLGKRPTTVVGDVPLPDGQVLTTEVPQLQSEFGTYPAVAFLQVRTYF
jgi:hypothetical protein